MKVDCEITDVVQLPDYIFWYHDGIRVLDTRDPNLLVSIICVIYQKKSYLVRVISNIFLNMQDICYNKL